MTGVQTCALPISSSLGQGIQDYISAIGELLTGIGTETAGITTVTDSISKLATAVAAKLPELNTSLASHDSAQLLHLGITQNNPSKRIRKTDSTGNVIHSLVHRPVRQRMIISASLALDCPTKIKQ